jgi:hypothetical protein
MESTPPNVRGAADDSGATPRNRPAVEIDLTVARSAQAAGGHVVAAPVRVVDHVLQHAAVGGGDGRGRAGRDPDMRGARAGAEEDADVVAVDRAPVSLIRTNAM